MFWAVAHFLQFSPSDAKIPTGVSGTDNASTGMELDAQLKEHRAVVTRRLVPLNGGPNKTLLNLSTANFDIGVYRSRLLIVVLFIIE